MLELLRSMSRKEVVMMCFTICFFVTTVLATVKIILDAKKYNKRITEIENKTRSINMKVDEIKNIVSKR